MSETEQPLPTPTPDAADGAAQEAQPGGSTTARPECPRCASQNEVPYPKIPVRDSALRRTVREWMDTRPDLRDPQYVDALLLKGMLRRHANALSGQLTKNGILVKGEGRLKQALGTLLDIAAAVRKIDESLPDPPPPPAYRFVGRCQHGTCPTCEAEGWELRGDMPEAAPVDAISVEEATRMAKLAGLEVDMVLRALVELEADRAELVRLRSEVAEKREAAREPVAGEAIQQLEAPEEQRLLPVGGTA